MTDENRNEDSDWLQNAFDRALRGDNGVDPDAARPAVNPFGVTPPATNLRDDEGPIGHNELDLDFETEATVPPLAFIPVVDFGDDAADEEDDVEPDPFAVFTQAQSQPEPDIEPEIEPEPEYIEFLPTEALDVLEAPTETLDNPDAPTEVVDSLEALFGASDVTEADAETRIQALPPIEPAAAVETDAKPGNLARNGIAAGIIVLLGIGGFIGGSFLGGGTATPEPTPTAEPAPTAMREPGVWAWDQLFGGECIDPFTDPWATEFTVVDCAIPHAAQLVAIGDLADTTAGIFPGAEDVAAAVDAQCSTQGVLDLAAAGAYPNMQITTAYAPTQEDWDAGNTGYFCFVRLADASPITGSVQGAGPVVTE